MEKEGWAAQRPHCRRKALSSRIAWLLLSSLPADTARLHGATGHVFSRKRMQNELPEGGDNWGKMLRK